MNHRASRSLGFALIVAIVVFVIAQVAFAAPMPWKLFNEPAMLKANVFAAPSVCYTTDVAGNAQEIFVAGFRSTDGIYVMAYEPLSNRILFAFTPPDAKYPTEIGFGLVDTDNNNSIPPLRWQKFIYEAHNDVCPLLFPKTL